MSCSSFASAVYLSCIQSVSPGESYPRADSEVLNQVQERVLEHCDSFSCRDIVTATHRRVVYNILGRGVQVCPLYDMSCVSNVNHLGEQMYDRSTRQGQAFPHTEFQNYTRDPDVIQLMTRIFAISSDIVDTPREISTLK